ncbi:MAG: hypothetical protein L3K01_07660 [Thermoplasmata archaeon]|nr:hypothetical protein [Thermoplasmata archaeon]
MGPGPAGLEPHRGPVGADPDGMYKYVTPAYSYLRPRSYLMRHWTTIRYRRARARKGQVSAVAVILGLLLVVSFIANFIVAQLPGQMAQLETTHILTVENQLARLQATILAEAQNPGTHVALVSPVTLGSGASPPFGQAATSSIQTELAGVGTVANYQVSDLAPTVMAWNTGSACLAGGHGTCSTAGAKNTYNFLGNGSTLAITISGSGASLFYNLTGSNDSVTLTWSGPNAKTAVVVTSGTNDTVTFKKSDTDVASPSFFFSFYGATDKFTLTPNGSHSGPGGTKVAVKFVGSINGICPWGNLSGTDKLGNFGSGGKFVNITTTWWNALGNPTPAHSQSYSSGVGTFQNSTGFTNCAFTNAYPTAITSQESGGLLVHIFNHYVAQALVAFDQGGVVAEENGGGSVMVDQPTIVVVNRPAGTVAEVTLINLVMTPSTEAGLSTSAVMSQVLSVSHLSVIANRNQSLSSPFNFTITTLFPDAWWSYFQTVPSAFPQGATCVTITPIAAPYTCLAPPFGTVEEISAPMIVQSIILTAITAKVWLS